MKSQKLTPKRSNSKIDDQESRFKTDSDISNSKFKERELEKWVPDDDSEVLTFDEAQSSTKWDQFKVNQEKFGIESTYDEHLYTTRINTEAKDYQERVKKAELLAREIEDEATSDPHILEERGRLDDSGLDEEMKYSGVVREEDTKARDTRGEELMAALKSVNIADKKPLPAKPKTKPEKKTESFRLNAQSEINSLKKFSQTFKVPHKLPNDLLPILAKDKTKQDEILKKSSTLDTPKKKMDPTKPAFKLNPKAASFTPAGVSAKSSQSPKQPPKLPYANNNGNNRSPNNHSPRMNNQRPYSTGSNNSSKRHYQISPSEFFGGSDKVPTKEGQVEKSKKLRVVFNMFITAKNKADGEPPVIERAYTTPPTWDQTVDEPYYSLFPSPDTLKLPMSMYASPFMQTQVPAMGYPQFQQAPGSFPLLPQQGSPLPQLKNLTPNSQQAPMNFQQQQQMQAAMFYQQQLGMLPQSQPPMSGIYMPNNSEFMVPGYIPPPVNYSAGSPGSPRMMNPYQQNYNGNRRYSQRRSDN